MTKMNLRRKILIFLSLGALNAVFLAASVQLLALAEDRKPAATTDTGDGGSLVNNRSKSLDFDNDVIEGMNKNPLDSLTRLGRKDDKQQGHLYRRKSNFRREMRQTVQEMGYTQ